METLELIRLWLQLLDYASDREVCDGDYMFLADRMTAWMGQLLEPATHTPEWIGDHTRAAERKRVWRARRMSWRSPELP